ncbi:MAG TPA: PilZ domain-containing protein [Kofleriaceae bacterium]|jgi:hypothetical protein
MLDSRTTLRYPIDLPARLEIGGAQLSARIRNLSLGGVYLVGPTLPIGTRCKLRFKAPFVEGFDTWCITRWTTAEGCGLQFDSLQPMDIYQLARFIRSDWRVAERLPTDAILRPPAR